MSEMYDKTLERLVNYRQLRNMTQMDIERQFGVTQSHYSKMELGRSEIPYGFLCKLYNCRWDVDYLVTGVPRNRQNNVLDSLIASCRKDKRNEFMRLILWTIEQAGIMNDSDEIILEKQTLHMLLEGEALYSIMRLVRNVIGFSQVNMAERLGIGMKKYRRMERGDTHPDLELLTMIYHSSGCRPSLFLSGDKRKMELLNSLWNHMDVQMQQKVMTFLNSGIWITEL